MEKSCPIRRVVGMMRALVRRNGGEFGRPVLRLVFDDIYVCLCVRLSVGERQNGRT